MKGSTVTIRNVSRQFGRFSAVSDVSFEIKKGEFFSLLGPSGCGKTTLLRIIAGFEDPSEGDVLLDDSSVLSLPSNKRHVNTVFQSYALFPHLSVYENVAFPLRLKKTKENELDERVRHYLKLVKLDDHIFKMPSQMSGGQKQRVAIARALINEPSVLLLDAKLRQHMLIELDAIHDQIGITFIYVTHDQQEAISVSDRVAVMNEGVIQQVGTPAEIYETPANSFVATFIGETNMLQGNVVAKNNGIATLSTPNCGNILVAASQNVEIGDAVHCAIRPEKIRISKSKPVSDDSQNCIEGKVDETIYTGFLTKFFLTTAFGQQLKVFKQQHGAKEASDAVRYGDTAFAFWNAHDGYIVEARRP